MVLALGLFLLAVVPAGPEGDAQAFTSLLDAQGRTIADGRYAQEVRGALLQIDARYDFPDGRVVVEKAVLRLRPDIQQESWEWSERKGSDLIRSYEADFRTRKAIAT